MTVQNFSTFQKTLDHHTFLWYVVHMMSLIEISSYMLLAFHSKVKSSTGWDFVSIRHDNAGGKDLALMRIVSKNPFFFCLCKLTFSLFLVGWVTSQKTWCQWFQNQSKVNTIATASFWLMIFQLQLWTRNCVGLSNHMSLSWVQVAIHGTLSVVKHWLKNTLKMSGAREGWLV